MNQKTCIRCHFSLPATPEFFPIGRGYVDGLQSYCKSCKREVSRAWREQNRERHRELCRRWNRARSVEYLAWSAMIERCYNHKAKAYKHYGARGIAVCERWFAFESFLADMGPRPTPTYSLDRIDNNGNYEPGNCRWTTRTTQMRNTRVNHFLELNGERRTIAEWCEKLGMSYSTVSERIRRYGWTTEQALTLKPQKGRKPQ